MHSRRLFIIGAALLIFGLAARLNVNTVFQSFEWSGDGLLISKDYLRMMGWIDVFNVAMYSGAALLIIAVSVVQRPSAR